MEVKLATGPLSETEADLLVVSANKDTPLGQAAQQLDQAMGGLISSLVSEGGFKARAHQTDWIYPAPVRARRVLLLGAGDPGLYDARVLRQLAGAAARQGRSKGAKSICLALDPPQDLQPPRAVEIMADGGITGLAEPDLYKDDPDRRQVAGLLVWSQDGGQAVQDGLERGRKIAEAVNFGRWLGEEPGNIMTPVRVAEEAARMCHENGIECEVLDESAIREAGMNSLLSVASGSQWEPRVVVMSYKGGDGKKLGLVGKGVTFDTGGISIKPAQDMHHMKYDMCGAAAVIAALRGVAQAGIAANVVGVVGLVENMPGGRATRPGDVVRAANGKTIEIINTDAEGRLVLADALDLARKRGAERLVDVATLTGAIKVALGSEASGVMGTPQEWVDTVREAAEKAGERVWQLPLYPEYKTRLRSNIADLMNTGGRPGGAVVAATFLCQFVADTPWAHLDIAGTAWTERDSPWQTRGATGAIIRTLVALAESETGSGKREP